MSLYGLILAGGESRRMGRDKASMTFEGQSLLARAASLLEPVCDKVYVSVRNKTDEGERGRFAQIEDRHGGVGPADGIVSALAHADVTWLVVACDLPRLSASALAVLVDAHDASYEASAFADAGGLPEPLCALYEARCKAPMTAFLEQGIRCPRKMLLSMNTQLLDPAADDALANANTPEDWQSIAGASL